MTRPVGRLRLVPPIAPAAPAKRSSDRPPRNGSRPRPHNTLADDRRFAAYLVRTGRSPMQVQPLAQTGITEKLGFGEKSIWGAGCLLTSFTMAINYLQGSRFSVSQMNGILKGASAFAGSSMIRDKAFARFGFRPAIAHAHAGDIRAELEENHPVIIGVDYRAGSSSAFSAADHFILAVSVAPDGGVVCIDPSPLRGNVHVTLDATLSRSFVDGHGQQVHWQGVEMVFFRPLKP